MVRNAGVDHILVFSSRTLMMPRPRSAPTMNPPRTVPGKMAMPSALPRTDVGIALSDGFHDFVENNGRLLDAVRFVGLGAKTRRGRKQQEQRECAGGESCSHASTGITIRALVHLGFDPMRA